jgi:hypothetical protein
MTVRLVKRNRSVAGSEKQAQPPSSTELIVTTQGWIEEFRAKKAREQEAIHGSIKRN